MDDIEELKTRIKEQDEEIATLHDTLATLQDDAELLVGDTGMIQKLRKKRDDYRREAEALRNELDRMNQQYHLLEGVINPKQNQIADQFLDSMTESKRQELGVLLTVTSRPFSAAYIIALRNHEQGVVYIKTGVGAYFGNKEEFFEDMKRVQALVWRVPIPEDLRGPSLNNYGISDDLVLEAIQNVAFFLHDQSLRDQFGDRVDKIFKDMLQPHIDPRDIDQARRSFRESYKNTIDAMAVNRSTQSSPKIRAGRKPKQK